jgi:hypothetical protein
MASFDQTGYPNFPIIYNVDSSVGRSGANAPDDVALVQWLLHRVYTDNELFSPPEATDIAIDGYIGPHTLLWISAFQGDIHGLGLSCAADGRVDCARVGSGIFVPTIVWLNAFCARANPELFNDPSNDSDLSGGWGWVNSRPKSTWLFRPGQGLGWRSVSPIPWVNNPPGSGVGQYVNNPTGIGQPGGPSGVPNVGMRWINNPPANPFPTGTGYMWTNPALPSKWVMPPGPVGIHWYKTKGHFASYLSGGGVGGSGGGGGVTYQINAPGGDNSYVDDNQ